MIAIVTDSGCDLPEEIVQRFNIRVVPLAVTFGDQSFLAGVELENRGFYRMLSEAKELPKTSQPSAGDFLQVYQELTGSGHEVVSIHLSEQLSGTLASAKAAQQMMADGSGCGKLPQSSSRERLIRSFCSSFGVWSKLLAMTKASHPFWLW